MANRSSMSRVSSDPSAPSSVVSSHAQSQPLIPTADEIDRAEQNSQIAVGIIRRFVDTIRSVDAFAPIPSATRLALRGDGRRWADAKTASASPSALEDVRLMPLLQEAKVIDDVVSACGSVADGTFSEQGASVDNETSSSVSDRDRQGVVNAICIPLLTLLAQCYAVLDMVPQTSSAGTGDGMDKNDSLRQRDGRRNNIKQRPKPPRGLLSIADYTDCACMLEFLVCTSILPNLEESGTILPSPQDRVKSLPKSLSGRLHRKALLWADAVNIQSPSHSVAPSARWTAEQYQTKTKASTRIAIDCRLHRLCMHARVSCLHINSTQFGGKRNNITQSTGSSQIFAEVTQWEIASESAAVGRCREHTIAFA